MATITSDRITADVDSKDVVVFLIGMRVNKLWKVHKWVPISFAMTRMLRRLFTVPGLGMLDARTYVSGRTIQLVQYWESFEKLEHFARTSDEPHLQAWRQFNAKVGKNGDVGIFHETYLVPAGQHECIYVNMPPHGLSKAYGAVPVGARGHSAKKRLAGTDSPEAAAVPDDVALPVY